MRICLREHLAANHICNMSIIVSTNLYEIISCWFALLFIFIFCWYGVGFGGMVVGVGWDIEWAASHFFFIKMPEKSSDCEATSRRRYDSVVYSRIARVRIRLRWRCDWPQLSHRDACVGAWPREKRIQCAIGIPSFWTVRKWWYPDTERHLVTL